MRTFHSNEEHALDQEWPFSPSASTPQITTDGNERQRRQSHVFELNE
jgi:hypothetical protein